VTTPWVLYNEDDAVVSKLPDCDTLTNILGVENGGRRCGILSFMAGGYNIQAYKGQISCELRKESSFYLLNESDVLWFRNDSFRNNWFIEFPISMMRTNLMKQCSDYSINRAYDFQIEHGFTTAWFEQGLDRDYYKATYMKNPTSVKSLAEYCHGDITSIFIERPLINMKLLSSWTIDGGHNFDSKAI
jgi:hypothetical protein